MNEILEQLKEVLDSVHDYGSYLSAKCPFHSDSRPSFFVYPDTYRCSACGAWGRTENLFKRINNTGAKWIADIEPEYFNPFTDWKKKQSLCETLEIAWKNFNVNKEMANYINIQRGVSEPFRIALGIGYLESWFTFPIWDKEGRIVSAVARACPGSKYISKYILPNRTDSRLLYVPNWKYINQNRILVTFGIVDAITLAINGVMAVSSLTGKTVNPMAFSSFPQRITIIPDQGEEKDAYLLASRLGLRGETYIPKYPEGCKDINDIWMKKPELLKEIVHELKLV